MWDGEIVLDGSIMNASLFATLLATAACGVAGAAGPELVDQAVTGTSAVCKATMPPMMKWDGKPLPKPQSAQAVIFLVASASAPGRLWAIEADGDHIAVWVDLAMIDSGRLLDVIFGSSGTSAVPVVKGGPPTPPRRDDDPNYYLNYAAGLPDFASSVEKACSGLPTGQ